MVLECAAGQIPVRATGSVKEGIRKMKTATWICDTCGGEISDVSQGWVEWLTRVDGDERAGRGLRLVHHWPASPKQGKYRCQYNTEDEHKKDGSTLLDSPLEHFWGADGLMRLLGLLSEDELPKADVIEMIKRLHIGGYELARRHFEGAIADGAFDTNTKPGFHTQAQIKTTLDWLRKNNA